MPGRLNCQCWSSWSGTTCQINLGVGDSDRHSAAGQHFFSCGSFKTDCGHSVLAGAEPQATRSGLSGLEKAVAQRGSHRRYAALSRSVHVDCRVGLHFALVGESVQRIRPHGLTYIVSPSVVSPWYRLLLWSQQRSPRIEISTTVNCSRMDFPSTLYWSVRLSPALTWPGTCTGNFLLEEKSRKFETFSRSPRPVVRMVSAGSSADTEADSIAAVKKIQYWANRIWDSEVKR